IEKKGLDIHQSISDLSERGSVCNNRDMGLVMGTFSMHNKQVDYHGVRVPV
ncbi:hypothetical protein DNTS_021127, partial [Danionella cerebrum]